MTRTRIASLALFATVAFAAPGVALADGGPAAVAPAPHKNPIKRFLNAAGRRIHELKASVGAKVDGLKAHVAFAKLTREVPQAKRLYKAERGNANWTAARGWINVGAGAVTTGAGIGTAAAGIGSGNPWFTLAGLTAAGVGDQQIDHGFNLLHQAGAAKQAARVTTVRAMQSRGLLTSKETRAFRRAGWLSPPFVPETR